MSKYSEVLDLFENYSQKYDITEKIESMMSDASYDSNNKYKVYSDSRTNCNVISLDALSQKIHRKIRFSESSADSESMASTDAFYISDDEEWFFIEFKNQKLKDAYDSVKNKAYQTWHMIMDICYENRIESTNLFRDFFDNPINYAKRKVNLVVVFEEEKDPHNAILLREARKSKIHFVPPKYLKLEKYIYKNVYCMTSAMLEKDIVKQIIVHNDTI